MSIDKIYYECEYCDKLFNDKSVLNNHLENIHENIPFVSIDLSDSEIPSDNEK